MTIRSIITALLLSLAISPPAHADQIEPQTLWELTQGASLIVLAEVERVGQADPRNPDYSYGGDVARLRVLEVWKGTKPELLEVTFRKNLICPTPSRYEPGRRVVAFLKPLTRSWLTIGYSYGTRYPRDDSAVQAYRVAVRMALEAQESSREKQRVEWAVNIAVHPATRWDGLYTLVPEFDADELQAHAKLSLRQQQLLADAFVKAPLGGNGTLARVLGLLQDYPSKDVDETALSLLEMSLQEPESLLAYTDDEMKLIARRLGKPLVEEPKRINKDSYEPDAARSARLKRQWESFKKANHLTPAPLPRPLEGETPP